MIKPIVAIVGRPNVGKSTLFNKLVGHRVSIVDDTPGVTRDRIYADVEWSGRNFILIDTGGIEPKTTDEILIQMRTQANIAIADADVIVFMVNSRDGITASDIDVTTMLKKSGKPLILAVNKLDNVGALPADFYEFYNLGLGDPVAISSLHGLGTGDLLDEIIKHFPVYNDFEPEEDVLRVAVIGRPNAGKSSLINKILGEERVIVSAIPGTTRDAIDTPFEKDGQKYVLIDTAGIRRKSRVDENIERYSVMRSYTAVDRADVCVLIIDGNEGLSEQDAKIAGYAHDQGKAFVIAVNKWDIVEKDTKTMKKYTDDVYDILSFMQYAPVVFISAKTGVRVPKLFELISYVNEQNNMRITTGALNDIINESTIKVQPPSDKGKRLKIFYATQASTKPPTFVLFVNDKELLHFSYLRYLENNIREAFALIATPIRFIIRERSKEDK